MSESLYRFYTYNENDLHSLAGHYLWFSKLEDFNDPFEGGLYEAIESASFHKVTEEEYTDLFTSINSKDGHSTEDIATSLIDMRKNGTFETVMKRTMQGQLDTINMIADEVVNEQLHCCFSRNGEIYALKNKQMWALYANGLRGFALEFCKDALTNGLYKNIGRRLHYSNMNYDDEFKFTAAQLIHETLVERSEDLGFNRIISRKDSYWSYENEFRISDTPSGHDNKYNFPVEAIKSITLGRKMDKMKRVTLITVLKSIGLNIKTQVNVAEINRKTLKLDIIPFNEANFD